MSRFALPHELVGLLVKKMQAPSSVYFTRRADDLRRVSNVKLYPLRQTPETVHPANVRVDPPGGLCSTGGSKLGVSH